MPTGGWQRNSGEQRLTEESENKNSKTLHSSTKTETVKKLSLDELLVMTCIAICTTHTDDIPFLQEGQNVTAGCSTCVCDPAGSAVCTCNEQNTTCADDFEQ